MPSTSETQLTHRPRFSSAVLAIALLLGALPLLMPRVWLVSLCSDDAFYYFTIARNIVDGHGCTFDRISPTNGFHPLYMLCTLGVYALCNGTVDLPVRLIMTLNVLFALSSARIAYHLAHRRLAPGYGWLAVTVLLLPPTFAAMLNGMETGILTLALLCLILGCYAWRLHQPHSGLRGGLLLGSLLALVTLCRLDSIFLLPAALLSSTVIGYQQRFSSVRIRRHILAILAGFAPLGGAFVAWNLAAFGAFMPISGSVKSAWPRPSDILAFHGDHLLGLMLLASLVLLLAVYVLAAPSPRARFREVVSSPMLLLVLACAAHFGYAMLFLRWGVYWWHFSMYGVVLALLLPQTVKALVSAYPRVRHLVAPMCVSLGVVAIALNAVRFNSLLARHRAWLAAADWANHNIPSHAVIALKDAGIFGYYSQHRVMNLDGKANGYAYRDSLRRGALEQYLNSAGVAYIAEIATRYWDGRATIVIPRARQPLLMFEMDQADELYRSLPYAARPFTSGPSGVFRFSIWRYRGDLGIKQSEPPRESSSSLSWPPRRGGAERVGSLKDALEARSPGVADARCAVKAHRTPVRRGLRGPQGRSAARPPSPAGRRTCLTSADTCPMDGGSGLHPLGRWESNVTKRTVLLHWACAHAVLRAATAME